MSILSSKKNSNIAAAVNVQLSGTQSPLRLLTVYLPTMKKKIKAMEKNRIKKALKDSSEMATLGTELYEGLPEALQKKISLEYFLELVVKNKKVVLADKVHRKTKRKKQK